MKTARVKILSVGGGSGGHVSPVVAVIDQLVEQIPNCEIRFWCDRRYFKQSLSLMQQASAEVKVSTVVAGKLRRYHGIGFIEHLRDYKTILHNILDIFLVVVGFLQSIIKLLIFRPQVVFLKGGFVCLPVGYAAYLLRVPIVIHDSDTHPGLTNRLIAPLARCITTGAPLEFYNYPSEKTEYVGIPIRKEFRPVKGSGKQALKQKLGIAPTHPMVFVTGGGLGAKRVNEAILTIAPTLAKEATILHVTGVKQYDELVKQAENIPNYQLLSFISENFSDYLKAADVVVSRAGASALAEISAVATPAILVPNQQLVGNHQTKNAKLYAHENAAIVMDEKELARQPQHLLTNIEHLLENEKARSEMSKKLQRLAKPNAAQEVAKIIKQVAESV